MTRSNLPPLAARWHLRLAAALAARRTRRRAEQRQRILAAVATFSGWAPVADVAVRAGMPARALPDALAELEQRGHVASRLERYRWPVERLPRRIWWATPAGRRASAAHDGHGNFNARKAFPAIFHPPRM